MPLRHTLLGLLHWAPMHGYLLKHHARGFSWMYPMSNTNIYPALRGLEADGFIEHHEEIRDGRVRKVYRVTKAGSLELGRWLIEAPEPESVTLRDEMLIKVSMMSEAVAEDAREWLEQIREDLRDQIEETQAGLDAGEMSPYTRITMQYGIDLLKLREGFVANVLELGAKQDASLTADAEDS